MKKILLVPALLLSVSAMATDYNYEISPVVGYNIAEGNLNLKNEPIVGLEAQYNGFDCLIKPELSILHSDGVNSEEVTPARETDVTRVALNGVYELNNIDSIVPFVKAGLGYETLSKQIANNADGAFFDAGAGAKLSLTDSIALKLEALYMLKHNKKFGDSNLALLAGLNFAFGPKAQPEPVDGDDDKDGVLNSIDKCLTTPPGATVDASGCTVDGDDDKDGVLNSSDKCPNTEAGAKVDEVGCKIVEVEVVNLRVNFKFDSLETQNTPESQIQEFSNFMNKNTNYSAKIIGHTDSKGPEAYNQALSQKRADAVKNMIVSRGVSADRLSTDGKGETSPIATNDTKEGRAQNRRIEAEITKH
ncbi:OmpA family protein [Sulfurimonas sp.]